ncbi:MAG: arsenate reductase (glutaredoxin) [Chitinophagales bacterium]|nr:arsenate reductase (glutaredoxin) [Chitinophagales bacterium]
MKTIIYHNPRCSKSREGLCMLEDLGEDVEIRNYIKEPPTYKELYDLIKLLKVEPLDIIRKKESIFKEKYAGKKLTKKQWIEAMIQNPILIERPIVVKGNKAVIGRPPTLIKDLIK